MTTRVAKGRISSTSSFQHVQSLSGPRAVPQSWTCRDPSLPTYGFVLTSTSAEDVRRRMRRHGVSTGAAPGNACARYALQTGGPVIVEGMAGEKGFGLSALSRDHGIVSGASVLIGPKDGRWGALRVLSSRRWAFTVDDVNFLLAVANVLSGAIARVRDEEEVQHGVSLKPNHAQLADRPLLPLACRGACRTGDRHRAVGDR